MFLFGCILLTGFFLYFARKRLQEARWQGEKKSLRDVNFQIKACTYGSRRHMEIWIGVAGLAGGDFLLKPETGFDRFCKKIGLVKEYQTGNPTFDEAVYIIADDADTRREIAASPALMEAALALFEGEGREYSVVQALRNERGRLWLEVRINWTASEQDLRKMARFCVPRLSAIAAALKARRTGLPGRGKARFGAAITVLQAAVLALACAGGAQAILWVFGFVFFGQAPYTLDQAALLRDAALLAGGLLLALLLAGFMLAGKSARAHLLLLELTLLGGFGALGVAWGQLRYLNMEFDHSAAVDYTVQVQGRRAYTNGKTGDSYYIEIDDWLRPGETMEIYVREGLYKQARIGASLGIRQRAGRLGYRWVESVTAAVPP